jgi:transposase
MSKIHSWEVSDELWWWVEPFVPVGAARIKGREYQRRPEGGRKALQPRQVVAAIVYVLRTGCQWKALPKSFGSATAVHRRFQQWRAAGFFRKLWQAGLAEYDDLEGIAWERQSIDGTQGKAPLALEAVGNNPTDRGKKRHQTQFAGGQDWRPALAYRQRGQPA